ncbi:MAG: hypothetical protein R2715_20465 [Ilumatobacteraceae bacterium]
MTDKTYRAKSGRTLTDAEIETLADEVSVTDATNSSEIIRRALRACLDVA